MKILFVFLLGLVSVRAFTQDSWKICLDKKTFLRSSVEDAEKNVIKLTAANLQRMKTLLVSYKAANPKKGWERTIIIYDEKDQELKKQAGPELSLTISELKSLLRKSKTLEIYTISLPADPKLKAQVRVRRVHLCTLVLQ